MGRPRLPVGTPGDTNTFELPDGSWRARCKFRDFDGVTRTIARYAKTERAAKAKLAEAVGERQRANGLTINGQMSVSKLVEDWLERLDAAGRRAVGTRQQYRKAANAYVIPALGGYKVAEVDVVVCDRALRTIHTERGYSVAKLSRAVMSGAFGYAVRQRALPANPMRDVEELPSTVKAARGLEPAEADDLTDRLRTDARALELDLPDLVDFMLGTGARIGEALAARDDTIDLEAGTWEVDATVVRIRGGRAHGGGLVLQPPKTDTSHRVLALPPFVVDMLERRRDEIRLASPERAVFPSPHAKALRDPSNCAGDLKEVLTHLACSGCAGDRYTDKGPCKDKGPYAWVTFHVFRKTALTRFDEAGATAREAANQAGHANVSMTLNRYYARRVANPDAARILDR